MLTKKDLKRWGQSGSFQEFLRLQPFDKTFKITALMFILILLIGFTKWTICRMCLASCLIDSPNVTSQDKPKHECVIGLETAGRYQIQSKACFILLFKTLPCPPESTLKFWQVVKKKSRKICLGYVSYLSFIHELMQLSIQWVKISPRHGFRC